MYLAAPGTHDGLPPPLPHRANSQFCPPQQRQFLCPNTSKILPDYPHVIRYTAPSLSHTLIKIWGILRQRHTLHQLLPSLTSFTTTNIKMVSCSDSNSRYQVLERQATAPLPEKHFSQDTCKSKFVTAMLEPRASMSKSENY